MSSGGAWDGMIEQQLETVDVSDELLREIYNAAWNASIMRHEPSLTSERHALRAVANAARDRALELDALLAAIRTPIEGDPT